MERYNPFERVEETSQESIVYGESSPLERQISSASNQRSSVAEPMMAASRNTAGSSPKGRYTTSFPDPFGDLEHQHSGGLNDITSRPATSTEFGSARSNSVTFSRTLEDAESGSQQVRGSASRQASGLTTFLTRATSVTSSTVTDRMNEAVGSVRSAVDSLSNQIQQVVPGGSINNSQQTNSSNQTVQQQQQHQQSQPQSTASYLASKFSSASQFGSTTLQGQSSSPLPVISRQRVLLVLEDPELLQWPQQFISYRKFAAASPGQQSSLTSFISSATAQLTSTAATSLGLGAGGKAESADLVEQADYSNVSVLSNQASSTVTVLVSARDSRGSLNPASKGAQKIIRPEFVVVRQNVAADNQLKALVLGLDHCMVPMLEPVEIWSVFQDRYQIFSRLLRVQKRLGKENFPLVPQIYCQTSNDLNNYLQSSSTIRMPCLVRTVSDPKSKIKVDNISVLKSLATLMGTTNNLGCTLEPSLEVKCDLIVQKIGNSLKLFKRIVVQNTEAGSQTAGEALSSSSASSTTGFFTQSQSETQPQPTSRFEGGKQSLLRQSSLGGSMLSSLISSSTASSQSGAAKQQQQQSSNGPTSYEKMAEVTNRYKNWVEAVAREFDNKLEAFCLKIVVTTSDREYLVGMNNCSMAFLGSPDNQEEDRRNFVELIINSMNTAVPSKINLSREPSSGFGGATLASAGDNCGENGRLMAREERSLPLSMTPTKGTAFSSAYGQTQKATGEPYMMTDKKKFTSQSQINGFEENTANRHTELPLRSYGALSSRSQSVSMNQSDYLSEADGGSSLKHHKGSLFMNRRGSDQLAPDDFVLSADGSERQQSCTSSRMSQHQRQASLGQSFFDQTSTAFSSLQKQSWSFFKRLDSRAGDGTPPPSAKSEQTFAQISNNSTSNFPQDSESNLRFYESSRGQAAAVDYKSQSIDCALVETGGVKSRPPKPPPPRSVQTMQDSSSFSPKQIQTPNSTPITTRQNSTVRSSGSELNHDKPYEPYDPELAQMLRSDHHHHQQSSNEHLELGSQSAGSGGSIGSMTELRGRSVEGVRRNLEAMKRADSSSTTNSETTSTEDTMNNLKKTFASIFGDKCE